jgi:hypothetical protein
MPFTEMLTAMLADPFRIVLLAGLVLTQRNTAAVTGRLLPLALGVLFVAVILPMTTLQGMPLVPAIGLGLVANVILLLPILGAFALWDRRPR